MRYIQVWILNNDGKLISPHLMYYRPFDPEHYEDEIDEDEVLDEEGRTRTKLKVLLHFIYLHNFNCLCRR